MQLNPAFHVLSLIAFLAMSAQAALGETIKSRQASFQIETIAKNLNHPWSFAFLPNGNILITERSGALRIVRNGKLDPTPVKGLPPISAGGQGGLLDIVLHPDFTKNRKIYFTFSGRDNTGIGTEVAHGHFDGKKLSNVKIIFKARPKTGSRLHFGSRLVFDRNSKLFITIGEKFRMRHAQNLRSHLGSIIRLNDDGSVPKDNPFTRKQSALSEIYSYGHRNPQGLALHPITGKIWAHEHGPQGGDEVNIIQRGANYGWPKITYGINYDGTVISNKTHAPGMKQPVIHWTPSIAPSGMAFYTGNRFPEWKGDLFVGALAHTHLRRLEIRNGKVIEQEKLLQNLDERIRDVRSGPDGYLYVLTDSDEGRLLKLKPAS